LSPLRRLATHARAVGLPLLGLVCVPQAPILAQSPGPQAPTVVVRPADHSVSHFGGTAPAVKPLPITLDTVLRLAGEQNRQIALARERVREACAEKHVADMAWLPNLHVGTSYYRHEGGIQNEDGTLTHSSFGALFNGLELHGRFDIREATFQKINAERRVWQQRGELSRITSEQLLEAANTYIDLLVARTSVAVLREMEKLQEELLGRAEKAVTVEPGMRLQVESLLADLRGHRATVAKVVQQGDAAAAKLAYLLGLDPCVELVPLDARLLPIDLVNADLPLCQLVELALENGPGVVELERLLALIQSGLERSRSPAMMLPILEMRMAEGAFGAGPGASLGWDNRWDLNLQARWNLTGLATARDRQRAAESKLQQVHLLYQDLRGKLTAGVQDAREAILSGRQQIHFGEQQIRHAREAYRLSHERLVRNVTGSSITEVQQTIRLLELAELTQVSTIGAYDKAQLRLMILLGPAYCNQGVAAAGLPPAGEERLPIPGERKP
jgi:outer membrane protein TolC